MNITTTTADKTYNQGDIIFDAALSCSASVRLSRLASTFQRVKWNSIVIRIDGAYPTTCGGGFIPVFVRDPEDKPPSEASAVMAWAIANQVSMDAKWYSTCTLRVPATKDLLWTSNEGESRLWSPGTLYLVAKGGPAAVGTLTATFQWAVTLSEPSIEEPPDTQIPVTLPSDALLKFAESPSGVKHVVLSPLVGTPLNMKIGTYYSLPRATWLVGDGQPVNVSFVQCRLIVVDGEQGLYLACCYMADGGTPMPIFESDLGFKEIQLPKSDIFPGTTALRQFDPNTEFVAEYINVFTPGGIVQRPTGRMITQPVTRVVEATSEDYQTFNISGEV